VTAEVTGRLVRLQADGSLDRSFVAAAETSEGLGVRDIKVQPDGRIVIVNGSSRIRRLLANGASDPSFISRGNAGSGGGPQAPVPYAGAETPVTLTVSVRRSGPLWLLRNWNMIDLTHSWTVTETGTYAVTMVNARGEATGSIYVNESRAALPPVITSQSPAISSQSGRDVVLQVKAVAPGDPRYDPALISEWRLNGEWLGYSYGEWILPSIAANMAGTYTVLIRDRFGNATPGAPIVVTVDDTSRLINLSARAWVGPGYQNSPGEQGLFAGFVIPGPLNRRVLIRGLGPTLSRFGVGSPLAGTQLAVVAGDGRTAAFNAGWNAFPFSPVAAKPEDFLAVVAFALEPGSKDSAVVIELAPGAYTASLIGTYDSSNRKPGVGVGLIELYEYDNRSDRLSNLSARVMVGEGGEAAIPGIAVRGPVPKRLLVRAVGPSLAGFGVTAPLANPRLELRNESGQVIAENDDWGLQPDSAAVRQAAASVGAFALPEGSRDAARLVTVTPGNCTVLVVGAAGAAGIALVEVYELP